jgi:hypothetical protein
MRERRPDSPRPPWHVPVAVEHIAETGQHFELAADPTVRAEVARFANLRDLARFEAEFDVERHGAGGVQVSGRISATVGQNCVVTLEPLANEINETIAVRFVPEAEATAKPSPGEPESQDSPRAVKWNDPDPLIGGVVDLGAIATEFLILGLDPYPRKTGVAFDLPQDVTPDPSPFAALASLTKGRNEN